MKPNEFVKKHGIKKTSSELSVFQSSLAGYFGWAFVDELKRLVASHGIVEKHGGLEKAKEILSVLIESCKYGGLESVREDYHSLKQAIADVESCKA